MRLILRMFFMLKINLICQIQPLILKNTMLPEFGFLSLLFATTSALLLSIVPQIGIWRNKPTLTNTAWGLSYCFGIFTSVSIGILAYSFATDDFTLEYVAAHSNSQLPTFSKLPLLGRT